MSNRSHLHYESQARRAGQCLGTFLPAGAHFSERPPPLLQPPPLSLALTRGEPTSAWYTHLQTPHCCEALAAACDSRQHATVPRTTRTAAAAGRQTAPPAQPCTAPTRPTHKHTARRGLRPQAHNRQGGTKAHAPHPQAKLTHNQPSQSPNHKPAPSITTAGTRHNVDPTPVQALHELQRGAGGGPHGKPGGPPHASWRPEPAVSCGGQRRRPLRDRASQRNNSTTTSTDERTRVSREEPIHRG